MDTALVQSPRLYFDINLPTTTIVDVVQYKEADGDYWRSVPNTVDSRSWRSNINSDRGSYWRLKLHDYKSAKGRFREIHVQYPPSLTARDAMFTHTAANSTLNVSNAIKDMLRPMGREVLKYHCYAVDLPCSNFQIFWPIKKVAQNPHLGAVCDWFRQQFMESYETRKLALVIQWEGAFNSCGIALRLSTLGWFVFNFVSHRLCKYLRLY